VKIVADMIILSGLSSKTTFAKKRQKAKKNPPDRAGRAMSGEA
jgi:hypothetical protein